MIIQVKGGFVTFGKVRKIKNEINVKEAKYLLINNKRAAFSVNGDKGIPILFR